jgi:hypothetical protein
VDGDQHRLAEQGAGRAGVVRPARDLAPQARGQIRDPDLDAIDRQNAPFAPRSTKNGAGKRRRHPIRTRRYFFPAQMSPLRVVA